MPVPNKEEIKQKVDAIISRFVYGDDIERNEAERLRGLERSFGKYRERMDISNTEPMQEFLEELRRDIADINLALIEKVDLEQDERKALIYLKKRIESWLDFWTGSERRAVALSHEIDEEHAIKTQD